MWSFIITLLGGIVIGGLGSSALGPVGDLVTHQANKIFRTRLLTPEQLIVAYRRKILREKVVYRVEATPEGVLLKHLLYVPEGLFALFLIKKGWRLVEKKLTSEEVLREELAKWGYSEEDINRLLKITEYFPSPSDLITFAVREVYTPEIVEKFGMALEIPEKFLEEAEKAGLPKEQAENYWKAHWVLPSATQGYEMLHRLHPDLVKFFIKRWESMGFVSHEEYEKWRTEKGFTGSYEDYVVEKLGFSLEDMKRLLKVLDVMPYWRDRLAAISYIPFTRVDLRRMWDLRLITKEELVNRYMELGYTKEDAEKLALFAIAVSAATDLRRMYTKGQISVEGVRAELLRIGIPRERVEEWVKTIVKVDKPERLQKERDLTKAEVLKGVKKYIKLKASVEELKAVIEDMRAVGAPEEQIKPLVDELAKEEAELAKLWMTPERAKEYLLEMGYSSDEADYILAINGIVATGSPQTPLEMRRAIELLKKAKGEPYVEITDEMIQLEKEIMKLERRRRELEKVGKLEEAAAVKGEMELLKSKLREMLIRAGV